MRSVQLRERYKVAPLSLPFLMNGVISSYLGGTSLCLRGGGID
jgi:hypothetical protein